MKKIYLLLCTIICIFAMSACSSENGNDVIPVADEQALQTSVTSMLLTYSEYTDEELVSYGQQAIDSGYEQIAAMLNSLIAARAEAGAYRSVDDDWEIVYGEGTADITVTTRFEERDVVFHITVSDSGDGSQGLNIDSATFTPVYSLGDKLKSAGANTLFGIATVAIILLIMVGVISCFRFIPVLEARFAERKKEKEKRKEQGLPEISETAAPSETAVSEVSENLTDDLELVAVITAAIAAMEDVPADGLVVRSIRRSPKNKWNRA